MLPPAPPRTGRPSERASERAMPSTFSLERASARPPTQSSTRLTSAMGGGGGGLSVRGSVVGSCRIADRSIRRLWAPEAGAITGQRAPLNENIRLAAPPSRMKLPTDSQAHLLLRVRIYTVQCGVTQVKACGDCCLFPPRVCVVVFTCAWISCSCVIIIQL